MPSQNWNWKNQLQNNLTPRIILSFGLRFEYPFFLLHGAPWRAFQRRVPVATGDTLKHQIHNCVLFLVCVPMCAQGDMNYETET